MTDGRIDKMSDAIAQIRANGCDAENPSVYFSIHNNGYICRCIVCGRCGHHTGNNTQGHFWKHCSVLARLYPPKPGESFAKYENRVSPDFHQCCPGNCELYEEDGTRRAEVGK